MKKKSLSKNISYYILLQLFNTFFPLLMSSYVSKTLGPENLGKINFSQTILEVLLVFSSVGVLTYGVREISKLRENYLETQKVFSEIFWIRVIASVFTGAIYLILIFEINQLKSEILLNLITLSMVISNIFNLEWLLIGVEDYKIITLRNIGIKILTFILIILYIKEKNDYILFYGILSFGGWLSNLLTFYYSKKYTKLKLIKINLKKYMKILGPFFIITIVTSLQNSFGNILLGTYKAPDQIAFFIRAKQIQTIGLTLSLSISTVIVPRISYYWYNSREQYFLLLKKSFNINILISFPVVAMMIILSSQINFILGGEKFLKASLPLKIIAPVVIIKCFYNWYFYQIFIPLEKEKMATSIQIIVMVITIVFNVLLIPKYGYLGASYSYLVSEMISVLAYSFCTFKLIKLDIDKSTLYKVFYSTSIMSLVLAIMLKKEFSIVNIFLACLLSGSSFLICLYIFKVEEIYNILKLIKQLNLKKKEKNYFEKK